MKKVVGIILMMVIVMTISAAVAEYYDHRDDLWFDSILDEFNNAFEKGEMIDSTTVLYEGIIYNASSSITPSGVGYEGPIDRSHTGEIEKLLEKTLEDEGAMFPMVDITFAGKDEYDRDIYLITIAMMENINTYEGEKSGSGFLKDGIYYDHIKVLGYIY